MAAKSVKTVVPRIAGFPVAGVGASAGGLDAFKRLVKAIPDNSGIAWVLLQHQHPAYESKLTELLQHITSIPVTEISNNLVIKPDHIYVLPANKILTVKDGRLKTSPRPAGNAAANFPVNVFFESLAHMYQEEAIGIVLSGTASDGTRGLKAIKDHGGIALCQDITSAAYAGMPESAIAAGVVDFILAPEKIPRKLISIKKWMHPEEAAEKIPEQDEHSFREILSLLHVHKGMDFTFYKQTTIRRRILRRMVLNKYKKFKDYIRYLETNKAEINALYQDMLIPVTHFFRDEKTFNNLCEGVFPNLVKNKQPDGMIRIWVAGCSTGEEAYSIAICFKEYLGDKDERIQIFATDLSQPAIAKARAGIYSKADAEAVSHHRLKKFFTPVAGGYQVNKDLRDMCVFAVHNFLKDPPFGKIDFISCRNVLIYMDTYLQKKALSIFHYSLNPKGLLILGKSENTIGITELFVSNNLPEKIFTRKDVPSKMMPLTSRKSEPVAAAETNHITWSASSRTDFQKLADDVILEKFTPPAVVVTEALDIVHFRGNTSTYLQQASGKPTHNLLKMAKTGLAFEIRSVLHKAIRQKKAVRKENIPVQLNKKQQLISLDAVPLEGMVEPHYLLVFNDAAGKINSRRSGTAMSDTKEEDSMRLVQLELELQQLREDMRIITAEQESSNEELQTSNEELLSSNEELQSLNEELETSKEELQSTVEELTVVNQEMINLNEQLAAEKEYAEAIIATVPQPVLILDAGLRVVTANQFFYQQFAMGESGVEGRLLYDIGNGEWRIPELKKMLEEILPQRQRVLGFEIEHWFSGSGNRAMRLNAREIVKEKADKLIMLTIEDVTGYVEAVKRIAETEHRYSSMIYSSPFMIAILEGEDLIIKNANDAILAKWNKGKDIIGKPLTTALPAAVERGTHLVLKKVYDTGEPYYGHEVPVPAITDGKTEILYYNFIYQPQRNMEGKIEGVAILANEVTTQALFNKRIKESEEKFQAAVAAVQGVVWTNNARGEMEGEQPGWASLTGQSYDEYQGYGWTQAVHPDDAQPTVDAWQLAVESGSIFIFEHRVQVKDGNWRTFTIRAIPLKNEDDSIRGWVGMHIDITLQKNAEKDVRESEQRFRNMAESSDILIGVNNESIHAVYFNKAWEKLTGKPVETLLNLGWADLLHPEDKEPFLSKFIRAFENRQSYDGEFRILNKDGAYSWLYARVQVRLHADGSYAGHISSCIDITERKLQEKALKESEALLQEQKRLYEAVAQNTPDLVYVFDLNYRFTYANEALLQMWGRSLEDSIGRGLLELGYEPWHASMHEREIDEIVKTRKMIRGEVSFPHATLGRRIYDYILAPVTNQAGEVIAVSGTTRDISDIKHAEEELKRSEEQFSMLADNMENLAWTADGEGYIYWYNKRWYDYTGTSLEEMKGWGWQKVHHPDHVDRVVEFLKTAWLKNEPIELTFPLRGANGHYKWFLTRAYPIVNEAGTITRWIGTNTDIDDQKKAEDQFRMLADQAPMWVWLTDKEINILYANTELLQFVGIDHYSGFTGHVWEQKVHPDDIQVVYRSFEKALTAAEPFSFECRVQNAANTGYEWFAIKGVPRFERDEFTGYIGTGINIQEQRRALEQLEYRKALLEAHNEASVDGILLVDTRGKILSYNHRFVEIWDMPPEITEAKDDEAALAFAATQLKDPGKFAEKVQWLYDNPDEISIDELYFNNGKIIERHGYPVKAPDGSYYAWSWMFRDITGQKQWEKAIRESEANFRLLAEEMPQKIVNTDTEGKVVYYNKNWTEYTGLPLEELYGDGWAKTIHPDDLEQLTRQWMHSVQTGEVFEMEHRIQHHNGEFGWHINRAVPVKNEHGEIVKWIGAATEIQKIKAEEQRKSDFIKMVSHELKTPVTSIKGYIQMLLSMLQDTVETDSGQVPVRSSLTRIDEQIKRLTRLITEMLDLSKLEESKLHLKKENLVLNDLAKETVQDIRFTNKSHHIQISETFSGSVYADKDRLQQVIINLVNNGIKYSPQQPEINMHILQKTAGTISVSVEDFGIGISETELDKIFDRFYRVTGKAENTFAGFGIGLYITREILTRHQGVIEVVSKPGKGSVFTFTLPLVP